MNSRIISTLLISSAIAGASETYIRGSYAGFFPDQPKQVTIISESDQRGESWKLLYEKKKIADGVLDIPLEGVEEESPFQFNYRCVLPPQIKAGTYHFVLGVDTLTFPVGDRPYDSFIESSLRYLKVQRSGSADTFDKEPGHFGDSAAFVMIRKPGTDEWIEDHRGRKLDMQGGWYASGNFEKFTSSIAFTTYYLLRAWESNPSQFDMMKNEQGVPKILDEAAFGLSYLMKCMPDDTTFVIQCGGFDSENGTRLPAWDRFEGKRPCMTAISPGDMGITAAALALGSKVFETRDASLAGEYRTMAEKVFRVGSRPGLKPVVLKTDYELYPDKEVRDNLLLGATELYTLTKSKTYLQYAQKVANTLKPVYWIGWENQSVPALLRLASYDTGKLNVAKQDISTFTEASEKSSNLWGYPLEYGFSSLYGSITAASAAAEYELQTGDDQFRPLVESVLRYTYGENNWGVSFVASKEVPVSSRKVNNPVYKLRNRNFPDGALVMGPVDTRTHRVESIWVNDDFEAHPDNRFNTEKISYYDHFDDYMTSDVWVLGVAQNILLMTQATALYTKGDSK